MLLSPIYYRFVPEVHNQLRKDEEEQDIGRLTRFVYSSGAVALVLGLINMILCLGVIGDLSAREAVQWKPVGLAGNGASVDMPTFDHVA